jgi:hypothetical protein
VILASILIAFTIKVSGEFWLLPSNEMLLLWPGRTAPSLE